MRIYRLFDVFLCIPLDACLFVALQSFTPLSSSTAYRPPSSPPLDHPPTHHHTTHLDPSPVVCLFMLRVHCSVALFRVLPSLLYLSLFPVPVIFSLRFLSPVSCLLSSLLLLSVLFVSYHTSHLSPHISAPHSPVPHNCELMYMYDQ